jgi:hypothetical protein
MSYGRHRHKDTQARFYIVYTSLDRTVFWLWKRLWASAKKDYRMNGEERPIAVDKILYVWPALNRPVWEGSVSA